MEMQRTRQGKLLMKPLKLLRRKSARDFLRLRRNPLRPRMSLTRKSRNEGQRPSVTREGFSRRKKASTRRRTQLKRRKPALLRVKKSLQSRRQLLQGLMKSEYRNWSEFQD